MKFELNNGKIINVLQALKNEYVQAKNYYSEHINIEDRIGVTSPEELKETYNEMLRQAHKEGIFTALSLIV